MKVTKHGELYKEESFKCSICKCEYTAYIKECELKSYTNKYGQIVYQTACYCPECLNKNFKYKKEGGTT